jgi:hypothetical protein
MFFGSFREIGAGGVEMENATWRCAGKGIFDRWDSPARNKRHGEKLVFTFKYNGETKTDLSMF